uniref:Uncharacterized protein n=1 Tax=Bionectria ochroleuca TaxID=29856 RepID=A0A8H7N3X3_BIOOC
MTKKHQKTFEAEQMASSIANEAFGSIRMIMAYSAQARVGERFSKWANEAKKHGQGVAPIVALQFGLIFFGVYATFGLAFWFGTKSFREGRIESVGIIVIVLMSVMLMVLSIQGLFTPFIAVNKAMVAACEFFSVVDTPPQKSGRLKEPDVSATDDIFFRAVDFAYPGRAHVKVLDDLDLRIEAGKVTALVGPSGSGKSTVIGLIERWYDLHGDSPVTTATKEEDQAANERELRTGRSNSIQESTSPAAVQLRGRVEVSGHDIFDIDLKWWRCQIGLVQQEPFLFNDTIYNNVAHGLIGSSLEAETEDQQRELIEEACREAFADEFIQRLPDGYHTMVGDSGTKLSGGQRQRISIARAIVKKPKILVLDEATSSIDVRGERIVQAALERASIGRTTITIAHRLSTIQKADHIVVLRKGKVVEEGTHRSLLGIEGGVYSGLVATQNLAMDDEKLDTDLQELKDIESHLSNERDDGGEATEGSTNIYKSGYKPQGLLGSFGRLLYELKSQFPLYMATVFFAMCAAAGTPLQAYLFAKIIVVFQYVDDMDRFTTQANFWSLMWVVLAIGTGFAQFGLQFVSNHLAVYISATYRMQYFNGLISQKVSFFDDEDNSVGTLTAKLGSDPRQLEELLGVNMAQVYMAIFNLSGSIAIAFAFGWKLALVAVCVTVPLGFLAGFYRLRHELQFEALSHAVFEESSKFAAESISAFRTVTSLTLEDTICRRYRELLSHHASKASRKSRWTSLILAFSDSMAMACQALIFWYGGKLLGSHEYEVFNFFVCYMAVISGAEAAGLAFSYGPNAAQASAAANRILGIRESKNINEVNQNDHIETAQNGIKIEFQHVWFKYPTRNIPIFEDLSITVEKGQYAAFVGSSGSGKTTIISLLERFYDVNRGKILTNGTNIMSVGIDEYRKQISLVAQDPTIFQGTIRENIVLGVEAETTDDEQVKAACRDASIHDFISSLPDGYNTEIGSKGVDLSGGQKQRIAIARALIRNPQLLLLDEATSSLDSESARLVQAAFEKVSKGRTMIVIAHQLSTIQNADVIFVLGEGKVLEKGNHIELLKRKNIYWNMCQNQALDS